MLKIEDMKFLDLNEETVDLFKILCDWIGMALVQPAPSRRPSARDSRRLIPA